MNYYLFDCTGDMPEPVGVFLSLEEAKKSAKDKSNHLIVKSNAELTDPDSIGETVDRLEKACEKNMPNGSVIDCTDIAIMHSREFLQKRKQAEKERLEAEKKALESTPPTHYFYVVTSGQRPTIKFAERTYKKAKSRAMGLAKARIVLYHAGALNLREETEIKRLAVIAERNNADKYKVIDPLGLAPKVKDAARFERRPQYQATGPGAGYESFARLFDEKPDNKTIKPEDDLEIMKNFIQRRAADLLQNDLSRVVDTRVDIPSIISEMLDHIINAPTGGRRTARWRGIRAGRSRDTLKALVLRVRRMFPEFTMEVDDSWLVTTQKPDNMNLKMLARSLRA